MLRKKAPISEERMLRVLEELSSFIVIVEGKNDEKALKSLGLKKIIAINSRPLVEIIEKIRKTGEREVVLLTDFDKQGRKIEAKLKQMLQMYKIHTNTRLRWSIMMFGRNKIEDLNNLLVVVGTGDAGFFTGGDIHGEISANFNKIYNKSKDKRKGCNRKA